MRKTPRDILNGDISNEDRHAWLASATADELSLFLRWAKQDSSWALHGRDYLNVVLANENIKLQKKITKLTVWMFILTLFMAFTSGYDLYVNFTKPDNPPTTNANIKNTISDAANTNEKSKDNKKTDTASPIRKK